MVSMVAELWVNVNICTLMICEAEQPSRIIRADGRGYFSHFSEAPMSQALIVERDARVGTDVEERTILDSTWSGDHNAIYQALHLKIGDVGTPFIRQSVMYQRDNLQASDDNHQFHVLQDQPQSRSLPTPVLESTQHHLLGFPTGTSLTPIST